MDVTLTEACIRLNSTAKTVKAWIKKGRFPGARIVKLNGLRQWAIPEEAIEQVRQIEAGISTTRNTETRQIFDPFKDILPLVTANVAKPQDDYLRLEMQEALQRIEVLERQQTAILARLDSLSIPDSRPVSPPLEAPKITSHSDKPTKSMESTDSTLPSGYVPLVDFWHGLPETSIGRYAKGHVTHGQWRHQGRVIKTALSPQQQADLYEVIKQHKAFQSCPYCPHV